MLILRKISYGQSIEFYGTYFADFYLTLSSDVQKKVEFVFRIIRTVDRVPAKFLKHVESTDGLYEIRVEYGSDIYRIFCFFDAGKLVIVANGFHKKSQKTPVQEFALAERLKKEYFDKKKEQVES